MQVSSVSSYRRQTATSRSLESRASQQSKNNIKNIVIDVAERRVKNANPGKSKSNVEDIVNAVIDQVMKTLDKKTEGISISDSLTAEPKPVVGEEVSVAGIEESLNASLQPDASGNVNEEEMQFGIVKFLLEKQSPEAAQAFSESVSKAMQNGMEIEDSVKFALSEIVDSGLIDANSAELINGVSFRAAQLDSDHTALFDSTGGPGDNTVAVMNMEQAIEKAKMALEQINSGEVDFEARALDAASNVAPGDASGGSSHFDGSGGSTSNGSSLNGFLWKPASESDGRLVVLLPQSLTGNVVAASIYSSLPASDSNRIEEGRFSGDSHNGGRAHFRFSKSGGSYPDGSYVVARLRDGSQVTFQIGDSSSRNS